MIQCYRDDAEIARRHQRTEQRPVGEGARKVLNGVGVDPAGERIKISKSSIVTTTATRTGAFLDRRITTRSITMPPTNETASVMTKAAQKGRPHSRSVQGDVGGEHRHLPCAKFTRLGRPVIITSANATLA